MSLEELWSLFPIELVPHCEQWQEWAAEEISALADDLSFCAPEISHIGSTAVPDIWAKPIVDILVEVPVGTDWLKIETVLEGVGYICMSESESRMSFNKGYTPAGFAEKVFHVHVRNLGDNDEIYFRDYLRENPVTVKEYESLKLSLLPEYRNNRGGYTDAKSEFVKRVTALAVLLKS